MDAHVADLLLHVVGFEIDAGHGTRALRIGEDGVRDLEPVDLDDGQSLAAVMVGDNRAEGDALSPFDIFPNFLGPKFDLHQRATTYLGGMATSS